MIKLKDSLLLASIKIRTYKMKSFEAVLNVFIAVVIISVGLISVDGVLNFTRKVFTSTSNDPFVVSVINFNKCYILDSACDNSFYTDAELKQEYPGTVYKQMALEPQFSQRLSTNLNTQKSDTKRNYNYAFTEPWFVQDALAAGMSFNDDHNGAIPVVVNDIVFTGGTFGDSGNNDFQKTYEDYQRLIKTEIGQEFYLKDTDNTSINVVVVGILNSSVTLISSKWEDVIYMPDWALARPAVQKLMSQAVGETLAVSFNNAAAMDKFVSDFNYSEGAAIPVIPVSSYVTSVIDTVQKGTFIVGILLALSAAYFISTIVGKIALESAKEIAIFRSFGASSADIRKILNTYIAVLINSGIVLGILFGYLICWLASSLVGDIVFYLLASLSGNLNQTPPGMLFMGFPWAAFLGVILILNLAGFLLCFLPILKASRTQIITVLRDE